MPFTPYHFGPAALIVLPLKKWIDIPVFVLANVVVDFEPLAVMVFQLNYPLHGYFHAFLFGGIVGLMWGFVAYLLFRPVFRPVMKFFRLPYQPTLLKMMLSGLLGIWLHVFIDSVSHPDVNPLWPVMGNPFYAVVGYQTLILLCEISLIAAIVIYSAIAVIRRQKEKTQP
jgi:membrane-bound metal-dependent hydrolase YbcI (DUF457 family)